MTVITLKNVPQSLRGDLTRWMQENCYGCLCGELQ
ncbi:type I-E CRISPR-associated endoribonuclease Cas2 [Megasphaera sp.]